MDNINLKLNISADKKISMALMASFVILTLQYFILIYFNLLDTSMANIVQLLSKVVVGIIFISVFPLVFKRCRIEFITIYYIALLIFLLNYLIFFDNRIYLIQLLFPIFFMCLPAFLYSLCIRNIKVFKETMKQASILVFIIGTILGILIFSGKVSVGTYSMSLSYYMLLPTLIFLDELIDRFSLKSLLIVLVSLLIILLFGSRGALLCTLIFVFLKMIRFTGKLTYIKLFYNLILSGVLLILLINFKPIFNYISNFLYLNFGIKSRSINLLLEEEVKLSGRDSIYRDVISELVNNPILGIGLAGDRRVLGGGYVHNIFLEILSDFGLLLGSIILILLIFLIIKSLFTKQKEKYNIFIIWISLGFIHLMVSSSYLIDIKFWIMLGIFVNLTNNRERKKKEVLQ